MKKLLVSLIVAGVIVAALGTATVVSAQSETPQPYFGQNGGGRYGYRVNSDLYEQDEVLHDLMMEAWSVELGISVDELNARLDGGETLSQIALSTGLSLDEFLTLSDSIRADATEQALADGLITQEQANLIQQSIQVRAGGQARGAAAAVRGMGGAMRGSGACLNLP
ncbi:MAG: hypothetical protein KBF64_06705 [Anaerolineaceae bacterium]|nr:hypothetical protein [Anaerolineaceae bacterium]